MQFLRYFSFTFITALLTGCYPESPESAQRFSSLQITGSDTCTNGFYHQLSLSAIQLTYQSVTYDPAYYAMPYPGGDVPPDKGVCSDVVIRASRKLGIDLQKEVHEDMAGNFSAYPNNWGLHGTDKNIDHRRVPNLMTFFKRKGVDLPVSTVASQYNCGDIVCWDLGKGITHIGMVVCKKSRDAQRNLVVHNIGSGQVLADCLFSYRIIGHYRYR